LKYLAKNEPGIFFSESIVPFWFSLFETLRVVFEDELAETFGRSNAEHQSVGRSLRVIGLTSVVEASIKKKKRSTRFVNLSRQKTLSFESNFSKRSLFGKCDSSIPHQSRKMCSKGNERKFIAFPRFDI
jgi:hypothetical protein